MNRTARSTTTVPWFSSTSATSSGWASSLTATFSTPTTRSSAWRRARMNPLTCSAARSWWACDAVTPTGAYDPNFGLGLPSVAIPAAGTFPSFVEPGRHNWRTLRLPRLRSRRYGAARHQAVRRGHRMGLAAPTSKVSTGTGRHIRCSSSQRGTPMDRSMRPFCPAACKRRDTTRRSCTGALRASFRIQPRPSSSSATWAIRRRSPRPSARRRTWKSHHANPSPPSTALNTPMASTSHSGVMASRPFGSRSFC